jgi:hypothetical protein
MKLQIDAYKVRSGDVLAGRVVARFEDYKNNREGVYWTTYFDAAGDVILTTRDWTVVVERAEVSA